MQAEESKFFVFDERMTYWIRWKSKTQNQDSSVHVNVVIVKKNRFGAAYHALSYKFYHKDSTRLRSVGLCTVFMFELPVGGAGTSLPTVKSHHLIHV